LILSVPDEVYSRNVSCALNLISVLYFHWVDTSPGGLLVPEGIIHPVVSVSIHDLLDILIIEIYSF